MPVAGVASSLKVLTINTHKGFSFLNRRFILHELRDAIRSVRADVVFLQEVLGEHAGHAPRWPGWPATPHYEFLADSLWPGFAYGRNAVYPAGHHGNALLSKWPILHSENFDLSGDGSSGVRLGRGAGGEPRGVLHGVIGVPGLAGGLHAVCVHLGLREGDRARQLERLCRIVRERIPARAPLVVAGDFNDWRERAHAVLARCAGLAEVFRQIDGRSARTFPARWPLLRLDRIYVRNAIAHAPVTLPRRPWSHLSDHVPLAAELTL